MLRGVNNWLEANRWAGDAVLATGLLVTALLLTHGISEGSPDPFWISALLIVPLYARRSQPRLVVVAVAAVCLLQLLLLPVPVIGDVAAPLAVHAATAHIRDRRWGAGALGAALCGALLGALRWADGWVGNEQFVLLFGACAAAVTAAYLLGARQRDHRERVEEQLTALQERNHLLAIERDQRADAVAAAERARIARELHDIVAHSLSVVVVQADGAAAAMLAAPQTAADIGPRVLGTIAETSRDALTEMRRMVAVLRSGSTGPSSVDPAGEAEYAPAPGVADVAALVEHVCATGVPVTYEQLGSPRSLPATTDLTVYRVIQESLTNVIRHGGPAAQAHVAVDYQPTQMRIDVIDSGRGGAALNDQSGHGLVGMRERVQLQGGTLLAGPRPGGGFAVGVSIPLAADFAGGRTWMSS